MSKPKFLLTIEDTKLGKQMSIGVDDLDDFTNPESLALIQKTKRSRTQAHRLIEHFQEYINNEQASSYSPK